MYAKQNVVHRRTWRPNQRAFNCQRPSELTAPWDGQRVHLQRVRLGPGRASSWRSSTAASAPIILRPGDHPGTGRLFLSAIVGLPATWPSS